MESIDIENIWQKFNSQLDKLEPLNRERMMEIILKRPQHRIKNMKLESMFGMISLPFFLVIGLHPHFKFIKFDWIFFSGCFLVLMVFIFLFRFNFKSYKLLKELNILENSCIDSLMKLEEFKKHYYTLSNFLIICNIGIYSGVTFIFWNDTNFNNQNIIFLIIFFLVSCFLGIFGSKMSKSKFEILELEISELKKFEE